MYIVARRIFNTFPFAGGRLPTLFIWRLIFDARTKSLTHVISGTHCLWLNGLAICTSTYAIRKRNSLHLWYSIFKKMKHWNKENDVNNPKVIDIYNVPYSFPRETVCKAMKVARILIALQMGNHQPRKIWWGQNVKLRPEYQLNRSWIVRRIPLRMMFMFNCAPTESG